MAKYEKQNFYDGQVLNAQHLRNIEDALVSTQEELEHASQDGHNHDDRYYTETEVDAKLQKKSNDGHNHDDRYYTEAEVEQKLGSKSNTGHSHDDRYYTIAEINAKLGTQVTYSLSGTTLTITTK